MKLLFIYISSLCVLLLLTLCSSKSHIWCATTTTTTTTSTEPPVPYTIKIIDSQNKRESVQVVPSEKYIDLLQVQCPNCTIEKLYLQHPLWKQWYNSDSSSSLAPSNVHYNNNNNNNKNTMKIQQRLFEETVEQATAAANEIDFTSYHNYNQLTSLLQQLHATYSNMTQLFSIGKSVKGRELWILKIFSPYSSSTTTTTTGGSINHRSNNANTLLEKPKFKYVANIHGDETVGRELALRLIHYILTQFTLEASFPDTDTDTDNQSMDSTTTTTSTSAVRRMVHLLNQVDVYIMPSMNPDGYEQKIRYNSNNFDLNRNYPDQFISSSSSSNRQVETEAMMNWISSTSHFVLSGNLHGGSLVASYGYDGIPSGKETSKIYSKSPDDSLNIYLANIYAKNHAKMSKREYNSEFGGSPHYGITNGAYWYALYGGLPDYNYLNAYCNDITLELSTTKNPPASALEQFWNDNFNSLIIFMEQSYKITMGGYIWSLTHNNENEQILILLNTTSVNIHVSGIEGHNVTTSDGIYYRMLVPQTEYNVTFEAPGYHSYKICGVRIENVDLRRSIVRLDVTMIPRTSSDNSTTFDTDRDDDDECDEIYQVPPVGEETVTTSTATTTTTTWSSLMLMIFVLGVFSI